ncbi:MAG: AMP-binding protein [Streptosporangiaceae bacterium]|nr:AMP-binding protein [Streptosporangiaceae bacterium]
MTSRVAGSYLLGERIEQVFAHHAKRAPDAVAVQQGTEQVTYGELRQEAGKVTSALRALGIGAGDFVPVLMDRSPQLVATLLGIMGTGAAYIAMDSGWPKGRIDDVVARSGSGFVADAAFFDGLPSTVTDFPPLSDGTVAACVFFTSGSTGRPKGVISPHRGTVRTLVEVPEIPLDQDTVFLQCAPLPWDGASIELWAPLLNGGRCVFLDPGLPALDASALRAAIDQGVNSLWLTSSLLNVLVEEDLELFQGIRLLLTGGERVSPTHARRILERFPGLHLVNGYGPAESTIFATVHRIRPEDVGDGAPDVPIGTPVPHTGVLLIGQDGEPVPAGEIGEIAISGDGLAIGYLGDPEETRKRFFTLDDARYYRTGDLAQADSNGILRYRGRSDRQFKINGLRIEPGEVEAVIETYPTISSCHVVRAELSPGRPQVGCVYATSDAAPVDLAELRNFSARKLLKGMLPSIACQVPRLPLGATGKVDSAAVLRLLQENSGEAAAPDALADGEAELFLSEVRSLLGRPELTLHDDLVAAGIDSLDAIRLSARLGARTGTRIPALHVYREPTVAGLLKAAALASEGHVSLLAAHADDGGPCSLSHAQERFWLAEQFFPGAADNMAVLAYVITGQLDTDVLQAALGDVVARHPSLRTLYAWSKTTATQRVLGTDDAQVRLAPVDPPADADGLPTRDIAEHLTADWFDTPFDLTKEIPLRARLARLDDERYLLCLHLHHVAFDGWSEDILIRDLHDAYASRVAGHPPLPAKPAITYADYSRWERAQIDQWVGADLPFWRDILESSPGPCLPAPAGLGEAERLETVLEVSPDIVEGLTRAAAQCGSPVMGALLAAAAQALSRTLGIRDVCLGTLTMGRHEPQLEHLIGYFVNPLAVPMHGVPDLTPGELLTVTGETIASVMDHSRTPFDRLVYELRPDRERHPWFQAWAVLHNPKPHGRPDSGLTIEPIWIRPPRTSFELMIEAFPQYSGGWELRISRRADGIDHDTAEALAAELATAISSLSSSAAALLS